MKNKSLIILGILVIICSSFILFEKEKPTLYIIGDSTVRNGNGTGNNQQWGWGSFIEAYFDTTKIAVRNHAIGGRSSRTFITEGRWDKIMATLKKGDYVMIQFGHNDGGALDDTARARGSIKGVGNETKEIYNPIMKKQEIVHTYGWYLRQYVKDAKAKGAHAIVCSPIPRNNWKDGKVTRSADSYSKWAKEIADAEAVPFINLNELVAIKYEAMGAQAVKSFFAVDHTHTNIDGAKLNAEIVVNALKQLKPGKLQMFMK